MDSELVKIVGGSHRLLDPPAPAYSHLTVRRAFIVWMHCGQKNKFRDVCNYYHYLEAMEEKLPAEKRAASRHHEFDIFTNNPPTSSFQTATFPHLYPNTPVHQHYINKIESIRNEKCVFKLEGFNRYKQTGVTPKEIFEVGRIIRQYCSQHHISLRQFLDEFHGYAQRCNIRESVASVAAYIHKKTLENELETLINIPLDYSFLNSSTETESEDSKELRKTDKKNIENKADVIEKDKSIKAEIENKEDNKLDETANTNESNENSENNSCTEFFKLFTSNNQNRTTYSPIPPTFEDFVHVLENGYYKPKCAETADKFKANEKIISLNFNPELNRNDSRLIM